MKHKGKKKSPPSDSASKNATIKNNNNNNNKGRQNFRENRSRRQGNKWQESNDDSDASFRSSLLNQGYYIREMNADGNCLFRSLADQLSYHQRESCGVGSSNSNSDSMHVVVRKDACNYLSQHKDEFQHFLLMEDDDEDVINVDQYIEMMRKDGQWGGNIEAVIASRVYKRNIKVFSSEYSNGVLSIENAEKDCERDRCLDDLMLSYHGNDHYNSVIRINNQQPTSRPPSSNDQMNSINTNNPDDRNNSQNKYVCNKDHNDTSQSKEETEHKSGTRPLTRGSNCVCGSGKKYKKCCMAEEKAKKRAAKFAAENHVVDAKESVTSNHQKKDNTDDDYIGNFRVITI